MYKEKYTRTNFEAFLVICYQTSYAAILAVKGIDAMIRLLVKEVAEGKGISMHRLWQISDVSLKTIQRLYHHPEESTTTHTLDKLAQALECHPSDLFEYIPGEKK